jgi:hypothetical protein
MLDVPEEDLRAIVKLSHLKPTGTMQMRAYKSQGRTPRAYPARQLIQLVEYVRVMRETAALPPAV